MISVVIKIVQIKFSNQKVPQTNQITKASSKPNINSRVAMESSIKVSLAKQPDQKAVDYINLAKQEQNLDRRFSYYQKAFNMIRAEYQKTHDPNLEISLTKLKNYLQVFPQYRQTDFYINQ